MVILHLWFVPSAFLSLDFVRAWMRLVSLLPSYYHCFSSMYLMGWAMAYESLLFHKGVVKLVIT